MTDANFSKHNDMRPYAPAEGFKQPRAYMRGPLTIELFVYRRGTSYMSVRFQLSGGFRAYAESYLCCFLEFCRTVGDIFLNLGSVILKPGPFTCGLFMHETSWAQLTVCTSRRR